MTVLHETLYDSATSGTSSGTFLSDTSDVSWCQKYLVSTHDPTVIERNQF